jgi:hypothetical protein
MNPLLLLKGLDLARIAAWAIAGLAIGVSVWGHGYMTGKSKLIEYQAAQATEAARIVVLQGEVTERVITRYIKVKGDTEIVTREVEREVTRYAQANPDGLCIDAEWVRLHNAAATNAVSKSTGRPDGQMRAPGPDPGGLRFPYRVPGPGDRDGELREASPLRGPHGRLAVVDR